MSSEAAKIDNSDRISHTFQGFEGFLVADARAKFRIGKHWNAALGLENLTNDRDYLFHPFPHRSFTGTDLPLVNASLAAPARRRRWGDTA